MSSIDLKNKISHLNYSFRRTLYKMIRYNKYIKVQKDRSNSVVGEVYSLKGFDENKCIFVHIPKAGGVSLSKSLFNNLGYGHLYIKNYKYIFNYNEFNNYFKFSIVRNPWDRLVSAYFFLKAGGFHDIDKKWYINNLSKYQDFDEFVLKWVNKSNIYKWIHFIPQFEFVTINSKLNVDKIYHIENMDFAVNDLEKRLNKSISLSHKNKTVSRKKDYRQYYTQKTKNIVEQVYSEDIQLFNYSFD